MRKTLFLAGSTGSIGESTLSCVDSLKEQGHFFDVVGLCAKKSCDRLLEQILTYHPAVAHIESQEGFEKIRKDVPSTTRLFYGEQGLLEAMEVVHFDLFLNALVGSAGIRPTLKAISRGAGLLLANKETLVSAGEVVNATLRKYGSKLIPIDSEHSAIFELYRLAQDKKDVARLILTASGGPFFFHPVENPTLEQALDHPTWDMGSKISIDSATMMNKGLEVIEAHYLFDMDFNRIEVVVHPQSLVHSAVECIDGNLYFQVSQNDMRRPIQNALTYPLLCESPLPSMSLPSVGQLTFYPPDFDRYPLLALAYECGRKKGSSLCALNAANEAAVSLFLEQKIDFGDIATLVKETVENHPFVEAPTLEEILSLDGAIKKSLLG